MTTTRNNATKQNVDHNYLWVVVEVCQATVVFPSLRRHTFGRNPSDQRGSSHIEYFCNKTKILKTV